MIEIKVKASTPVGKPNPNQDQFPYPTIYQSQIETFKAIKNGRNVLLVSGTGSGKTEATLCSLINNYLQPDSVAAILGLYPTRALLENQWKRFHEGSVGRWIQNHLPQDILRLNDYETIGKFMGGMFRKRLVRELTRPVALGTPDKLHWILNVLWHKHKKRPESQLTDWIPLETVRYYDEIHVFDSIGIAHLLLDELRNQILAEKEGISLPPLVFMSATCPDWLMGTLQKLFQVKVISGEGHHSPLNVRIYSAKDFGGSTKREEFFVQATSEMLQKTTKDILIIRNSKLTTHQLYCTLKRKFPTVSFFKLSSVHPQGYADYEVFKQEQPSKRAVLVSSPSAEIGVSHTFEGLITDSIEGSRLIQRIGRAGRETTKSSQCSEIVIIPADHNFYRMAEKILTQPRFSEFMERSTFTEYLMQLDARSEYPPTIPILVEAMHYHLNEMIAHHAGIEEGRRLAEDLHENMFQSGQEIFHSLPEIARVFEKFKQVFIHRDRAFALRDPMPSIEYLSPNIKAPSDNLLTALYYLSINEETVLDVEPVPPDPFGREWFVIGRAGRSFDSLIFQGKRGRPIPYPRRASQSFHIAEEKLEFFLMEGKKPEFKVLTLTRPSQASESVSYLFLTVKLLKTDWDFRRDGRIQFLFNDRRTPICLRDWMGIEILVDAKGSEFAKFCRKGSGIYYIMEYLLKKKMIDLPFPPCFDFLDWRFNIDRWIGFERRFGAAYELFRNLKPEYD